MQRTTSGAGRVWYGAAICLAAASMPARAIVADPPPRLCTALAAADAVIVGRVVSQHVSVDWDRWEARSMRVLKGNVPARFSFFSENGSARATPDVGRVNLLFLYRRGTRWEAMGSDPNGGGARLAGDERTIRRLTRGSGNGDASVIGRVASEQGVAAPRWPVTLTDLGTGRVRIAMTDQRGYFAAMLPPGRWSARVSKAGWSSRASLYTYDDPDRFVTKRGGCNDLRLEPVRR